MPTWCEEQKHHCHIHCPATVATKRRPKDIADDIDHVVNLISKSSREGAYGTKNHMALYSKFKRLLAELQKEAESVSD